MRLVPLTNETWQVFRSWFGFDIPPPKEAILVAEHIEGVEYLIGGTCIYSTDGPYVLFEHFALNQHAPIVTRHAVARQVFRAAKSYCTIHNKIAFTWVAFQGGMKMLEQVGFTPQPQAHLMTYIPGQEQAQASDQNSTAPKNIPVTQEPAHQPPTDDDIDSAMECMAAADKKAKALESSGADLEAEDEPEDEDDDLMPEIPKPAKKAKRAKKRARRRSLA